MARARLLASVGTPLAVWALLACQGSIEGTAALPGAAAAGGPAGSAGSTGVGNVVASLEHSAGLRRLTRVEYQNTVHSLLGADVSRDVLPKETLVEGHGQIAAAQKTGYEDIDAYYAQGDGVAVQVEATLSQSLGCNSAECFRDWAGRFLTLAFRAPPSADTLQRYLAIFDDVEAGETWDQRLETFLATVLSSPYFLYRQEIGRGAGELDAYEIATRLSYLIWQDTPDSQLLDKAAAGGLTSAADRQAELSRLLAEPRAELGLRGFTLDWLGLFENALGKKSPTVLTGTAPELPTLAERSFELTVQDALGQPGARFTDLFTLPGFFAESSLSAIIGADNAGPEMQKVVFPAGERLGILTHPLVLAAHSKESGASPFSIGKFIFENVLCKKIPPPIPGIPTVDSASSAQTLRQKLEELTQGQPCATCHSQIGPPGFAFLTFDPIGRYAATDGQGRPFDTAGDLLLPSVEAPVHFEDVAELSTILGEQPDVARCVAKRLFRFGYGRFEAAEGEPDLAGLEEQAVATNADVRTLLSALVTSDGFGKVRVKP